LPSLLIGGSDWGSVGRVLLLSGIAAIWTFCIYPGAAESEGAAKVGLRQHIPETILHKQIN